MWESFARWRAVNQPVTPANFTRFHSAGEVVGMRSPIVGSGGRGFLLSEGGDLEGALKPLVLAAKLLIVSSAVCTAMMSFPNLGLKAFSLI